MVHDFEVGVLPRHSQDLVQVFPRRGWGAGGRGCERPGGGGSPQPLSGPPPELCNRVTRPPTNPRIENRAQSLEKVWWPLKTCSCTSAALHWPPPTPPSAGADLWDPSFFVSGLLRPLVSQTGHRLQNFYIRMIFFLPRVEFLFKGLLLLQWGKFLGADLERKPKLGSWGGLA